MAASDAVSGFLESMKTQPLALALVVTNIALLALFYFIVQAAETRAKVNADQIQNMMQLLAHCRAAQLEQSL